MFNSVDEIPLAIALCVVSYHDDHVDPPVTEEYKQQLLLQSPDELKASLFKLAEKASESYDKRKPHLQFLINAYYYFAKQFLETPDDIDVHWRKLNRIN